MGNENLENGQIGIETKSDSGRGDFETLISDCVVNLPIYLIYCDFLVSKSN